MTEHSTPGQEPESFDREINVRGIFKTGAWLAVVTMVAFLIAWGYYRLLAHGEQRHDVKPSPIAAANQPRVPPGPGLQASPEAELAAFRANEDRELSSWGWVDHEKGIAHVPVERAIDAVAEAGKLPDLTAPIGKGPTP